MIKDFVIDIYKFFLKQKLDMDHSDTLKVIGDICLVTEKMYKLYKDVIHKTVESFSFNVKY